MLKHFSLAVFFLLPGLAKAGTLESIIATQQALIKQQQAAIERLQPVYLSDLDLKLTNVHSSRKDGVVWKPGTSGFILADGTVYSKGLQLHPPEITKVVAEVQVPAGHPIFSAILADIDPQATADYSWQFSVKKGGTIIPIGTYPRTLKNRVEFGLTGADSLIIEIDPKGTNNSDHAALVDAKFTY